MVMLMSVTRTTREIQNLSFGSTVDQKEKTSPRLCDVKIRPRYVRHVRPRFRGDVFCPPASAEILVLVGLTRLVNRIRDMG